MKNSSLKFILAGFPFILIGIVSNPWLISWLVNDTFTTTIFSGILIISIILIVIGWGIIFKKHKFLPWLYEKYKELGVILLNILLLFGLINFIAAMVLFKPVIDSSTASYFYNPVDLFNDSIEFMRKIYPGKNDEEIKELVLFKNPYANHPTLEYQERIQNTYAYNVGIEGIRYDKRVTGKNADSLLNGAVWVFGGSTTFGHGVLDDETITAFLNKQDTSRTYINFGVHAYHQSNEIEKLLLLLNKGYKPLEVIFIDGLNDVTRMIETNFHPLETPSLAKSAYSSDYNIATKETGNTIFKQLPATRLFRSLFGMEKGPDLKIKLPWNQYDDVYDAQNMYNTNPKQHFQSTILRSPYKEIDTTGLNYIVWKLQELYKNNYSFIQHIAKAYNFKFTIFYQPIGILSAKNPFWKDFTSNTKTPLYVNFNYIIPKVRKSISEWNYPEFYDISDIDDSCQECYVDLTHYNPQLNKLIASAILKTRKLNSKKPEPTAMFNNNQIANSEP